MAGNAPSSGGASSARGWGAVPTAPSNSSSSLPPVAPVPTGWAASNQLPGIPGPNAPFPTTLGQRADPGAVDEHRGSSKSSTGYPEPMSRGGQQVDDLTPESIKRFAGLIYETDTNAARVLAAYDFSEKYSETKRYNNRPHPIDFCGVLRYYTSYLCKIDNSYYVVERRVITEAARLADYCECLYCQLSSWNPLRVVYHQYKTRCLKVDAHDPHQLTRARYRAEKGYSQDITPQLVKLLEWLALLFLILYLTMR